MSEVERRDVLIAGVGLATAALAAASPAEAGDSSFMNNVPDPLLSGDALPTFKFALEKSEGKVIGNSYGKETTVKQLPISRGIAGVLSLPKIPSGLDRIVRQDHRIIDSNVCDPTRDWNVRGRHVQVAEPA
jgi:hypothetical protein